MSSHSLTLEDLPRDGERLDTSKFKKINSLALLLGAVGIVVSALYLFGAFGAERQSEFAYSWLFAYFFFFTITCGGIFWTMLQHTINAGWSVAIRRLFENLAGNMLWLVVLGLPLVFVPAIRESLWEWIVSHRQAAEHLQAGETVYDGLHHMAANDPHLHLLAGKYGYLNMPFWTARALFYFAVLAALAFFLRRWSVKQDTDGKFSHTFRSRTFCCLLMLPFALTMTFAAIDWVMALDYSWFSTMWGVYIFAGCAWSSMAVTIVAVTYLRSKGHLTKVVTGEHYHLMGKLLFAFTVFWAYIAFSQFFLIWYANITEETRFYLLRNTEGWWHISNIMVWGHFAATFVVLLSAGRKKRPVLMSLICVWVLFMHVLDIYWLVIPERGPSLTHGKDLWIDGAIWGDVIAFVGIGGLLTWAYFRRLATASLYPCRDPRLVESVNVKN